MQEENNRATYRQNPSNQAYFRWKGLTAGASAEGVAFQPGRPILRAAVLLNRDTYAASIARFTRRLKGKFAQLANSRVAQFTFANIGPPVQAAFNAQPLAPPTMQSPTSGVASSLPYGVSGSMLPQSLSGSGPGRPGVGMVALSAAQQTQQAQQLARPLQVAAPPSGTLQAGLLQNLHAHPTGAPRTPYPILPS